MYIHLPPAISSFVVRFRLGLNLIVRVHRIIRIAAQDLLVQKCRATDRVEHRLVKCILRVRRQPRVNTVGALHEPGKTARAAG